MRRTENKIVLVTRTTHLEELVVRFNTVEQARFYVQHLGAGRNAERADHRGHQPAAPTEPPVIALDARFDGLGGALHVQPPSLASAVAPADPTPACAACFTR